MKTRSSAQHSGQPLEKVSTDMERDYFMTAAEAAQYGIIVTVIAHRIGSQQPAPAASAKRHG